MARNILTFGTYSKMSKPFPKEHGLTDTNVIKEKLILFGDCF